MYVVLWVCLFLLSKEWWEFGLVVVGVVVVGVGEDEVVFVCIGFCFVDIFYSEIKRRYVFWLIIVDFCEYFF